MSEPTGMFGCVDHAQGCCEKWCAGCKSFLDITPKRMAVIKAAEAALPDLRAHVARHFELFGTSNPHYKFPLRNLLESIEALQEARDE